jgi:hypothetical protein
MHIKKKMSSDQDDSAVGDVNYFHCFLSVSAMHEILLTQPALITEKVLWSMWLVYK